MLGYWKDPGETSRVLTSMGYHTGDIGYKDAEGFLYVTGRKDELLKVGGHRVNPIEIEDFLMATDLLIEIAVIGVPDEMMGHRLIALVVPKDDTFNAHTLMQECAYVLPKHKQPVQIIKMRALPKKASGKIDREECTKFIIA
jgi:acyl-coenzyme A synthetase/AMP-(fatty) acid ligase